jgi:hypothetical protein
VEVSLGQQALRHPTRLLVVIAPEHCFRGEETLEADLHFESKRPDPFDLTQLLKEALGDMNQYNNYAHDVLNYAKGFEIHNVMNARELTVHSLQHLKWYANKTSGHIFYKNPN